MRKSHALHRSQQHSYRQLCLWLLTPRLMTAQRLRPYNVLRRMRCTLTMLTRLLPNPSPPLSPPFLTLSRVAGSTECASHIGEPRQCNAFAKWQISTTCRDVSAAKPFTHQCVNVQATWSEPIASVVLPGMIGNLTALTSLYVFLECRWPTYCRSPCPSIGVQPNPRLSYSGHANVPHAQYNDSEGQSSDSIEQNSARSCTCD